MRGVAGRPLGHAGGMDLRDDVLAANAAYAPVADPPSDRRPTRQIAVLTCMDVRIDVHGALGLDRQDSHVLRNAGGVVTDDAIRSLALSQWTLGTRAVLVVQHTDCGLQGLDEPGFRHRLYEAAGELPPWPIEAFDDVEASVREQVRRLTASPFLRHRDQIYGFVLDVATYRLRAVA
jgi:carbonic anhydrase